MQRNLLTFVSFLAVGIIILEIIVIVYLYWVFKGGKDNKVIKDKHYLELNLKFQYLQTFLIFASVLIIFLGWNVKSQVAEELKFDISSFKEEQMDSINQKTKYIYNSLVHLEHRKEEIRKDIEALISENQQLKKKHSELNNELEKRISDIETLLRIYIITDVPYGPKKIDTLYYKKLPSPINARKLPEFKKPPVINAESTSDRQVSILKSTTDYFIIKVAPYGVEDKGTVTFWIVDRY